MPDQIAEPFCAEKPDGILTGSPFGKSENEGHAWKSARSSRTLTGTSGACVTSVTIAM